jgi:hypothetical protein
MSSEPFSLLNLSSFFFKLGLCVRPWLLHINVSEKRAHTAYVTKRRLLVLEEQMVEEPCIKPLFGDGGGLWLLGNFINNQMNLLGLCYCRKRKKENPHILLWMQWR